MAEENRNDAAKTETKPSPLFGKKIVIVEDDAFLGGVILRHMLKDNIKAMLLTTGEGAAETIKKEMPDAVVLDIFLPGVTGLDILDMLRKDSATDKLPVLVVSNTDQAQDREKVKKLNAAFLIKALVTPSKIVDSLVEVMKK